MLAQMLKHGKCICLKIHMLLSLHHHESAKIAGTAFKVYLFVKVSLILNGLKRFLAVN